MLTTLKQWETEQNKITLKRNETEQKYQVIYTTKTKNETYTETRFYKSRNAAMNFIRKIVNQP